MGIPVAVWPEGHGRNERATLNGCILKHALASAYWLIRN